jgi:hypothetical protein
MKPGPPEYDDRLGIHINVWGKIWVHTHSYSPTRGLSFVARDLCRWERTPERIPPSWHPNRRSLRNVATGCWTPHCQESCPTDGEVPLWLAAIPSGLKTQNVKIQAPGYWSKHILSMYHTVLTSAQNIYSPHTFQTHENCKTKEMCSLKKQEFHIRMETTTDNQPTDRTGPDQTKPNQTEQNQTNQLQGTEPFLRGRQLRSYSRISQHFMTPEYSLPCSQEPSSGPYPEPHQSSPYHPITSH